MIKSTDDFLFNVVVICTLWNTMELCLLKIRLANSGNKRVPLCQHCVQVTSPAKLELSGVSKIDAIKLQLAEGHTPTQKKKAVFDTIPKPSSHTV